MTVQIEELVNRFEARTLTRRELRVAHGPGRERVSGLLLVLVLDAQSGPTEGLDGQLCGTQGIDMRQEVLASCLEPPDNAGP
jgi:hypothetical protein